MPRGLLSRYSAAPLDEGWALEHWSIDSHVFRPSQLQFIARVAGGIPASWIGPAWWYFVRHLWTPTLQAFEEAARQQREEAARQQRGSDGNGSDASTIVLGSDNDDEW